MPNQDDLAKTLAEHGQEHVLRHLDSLNPEERAAFTKDLSEIDFDLVGRLVDTWVKNTPAPVPFEAITAVDALPLIDENRAEDIAAYAEGEAVLKAGRVGVVTVAGGQGTRLGYDGPKGAYPIGPLTEKSIFQYHAEKIRNTQQRYGVTLPWYIMVSDANREATIAFFREHNYFGLNESDVQFFQQRMMPCVDEQGNLLLDCPGKLAQNPNGHGGTIPALVENGIVADCRKRGVDTLSYVQVDNWAVKIADPYFIGYHAQRASEFSSKIHRKRLPRESVGVHCVCDGVCHVIEYSELDIYPQLLETNPDGSLVHYAGNPAIHLLDVDFVDRVNSKFDEFPWHVAHKKVPFLNDAGERIEPDAPNAYKFETFIFDALQYVSRPPLYLETISAGEYTPTKQFDGPNSVVAARQSMSDYWGDWLEAAGVAVPRDGEGHVSVHIEISPAYALTKDEFLAKAKGKNYDCAEGLAIDASGAASK